MYIPHLRCVSGHVANPRQINFLIGYGPRTNPDTVIESSDADASGVAGEKNMFCVDFSS